MITFHPVLLCNGLVSFPEGLEKKDMFMNIHTSMKHQIKFREKAQCTVKLCAGPQEKKKIYHLNVSTDKSPSILRQISHTESMQIYHCALPLLHNVDITYRNSAISSLANSCVSELRICSFHSLNSV